MWELSFASIIGHFLFIHETDAGGVGGKGGPMTFGRSKAKLLDGGHVKTNFSDVAGCEEAKDDVKELVDFLKDQLSL